jgi:hypothetical protein
VAGIMLAHQEVDSVTGIMLALRGHRVGQIPAGSALRYSWPLAQKVSWCSVSRNPLVCARTHREPTYQPHKSKSQTV